MDTQFILILQLVADITLFLIGLFLLLRMRRSFLASQKLLTESDNLTELRRLLNESNDSVAAFSRIVDESTGTFKDLASDLLDLENRLKNLADSYEKKLNCSHKVSASDHYSHSEEYPSIMTLLNEGSSTAQIAARLGMTEGEISLIVGLERKKMEMAVR